VASPYQQQALVRKIIYIAIILALAFATYLVREAPGGIRTRAETLGVQEESLGDVQLTDSMLRLSLTGSRGFAVCCLWLAAQEKQKKHEWNELDVLVKSLIKLQPHFVTPWLFQSWNLAYNVSVESDRVKDKFFYIAEGVKLIAQGCRINRFSPDMRYTVGFYTQHKIGLADEYNVLRCLFQMSAIDPKDRDPSKLISRDEKNREIIDMARFEQFCKQNPMLVRRLRESNLKKTTPADIVDFLADNQKIPSMFDDSESVMKSNDSKAPLLPPESRFPALAPLTEGERADPNSSDFDNYQVSRDWYTYAAQIMPPPDPSLGPNEPNFDHTKYRMPKFMAPIIFRQYPARAQTYVAETMEKEGWFDKDGWKLPDDWFPQGFSNGKKAVIGENSNWAMRFWSEAYQMWKAHGERTGLYLSPEQMKTLEAKAAKFRSALGISPFDKDAQLPADKRTRELDEGQLAHIQLYWLGHFQRMTNFLHFYYCTQVEQDPKCIEIRKAFYQANQYANVGEREAALEIYRTTLPRWRELLLAHKEFREDDEIQESTYETVYKYLDLIQTLYGNRNRQLSFVVDFIGQGAMRPPMSVMWLPPVFASRDMVVATDDPIGKDAEGKEIIPPDVINRVLDRHRSPTAAPRPQRPEGAPSEPPPGVR
jgi:hypothetical protein